MFGLSKKSKKERALEERAYQAEKLKQAPKVGVARAQAEASQRIKAAKAGKGGGTLSKFVSGYEKFAETGKEMGLGDTSKFDMRPPGRSKKKDPFDF